MRSPALSFGRLLSLLAIGLPTIATGQTPPPVPPHVPTALALEAAQATIAACQKMGFNVSVAFVDAEGTTRLLLAADSAVTRASVSSEGKARMAATMNASTGVLKERAQTDPALAERLHAAGGDNPGGLPIVSKGMLVGAIGVGGAHGGQYDEQCAQTGLAAIAGRY